MKIKLLLAACAAVGLAAPGSAATLLSQPASTGIQASPGSLTYTFNAGAGAGNATFNLEGYLSIDGVGSCCTDTFTLLLNATPVVIGEYALGGTGSSVTVLAPGGSTINPISNGFFAGGNAFMSIPLMLANGVNTLTFSYAGASQGTGDEGWGLNSLLITGDALAPGGVPEPATWAMLILGFGAIGQLMRGRGKARYRARIRFA